jgi:hypothetical protein
MGPEIQIKRPNRQTLWQSQQPGNSPVQGWRKPKIINEFETEEIILKPENTTVKDFALKSKKRLCSA